MDEPQEKRTERWRRPSWITVLYLLPFAVLLLVANVAEDPLPDTLGYGKYGPHFEDDPETAQGWPKRYLRRQIGSPWRPWEGVVAFNWQAAIVNLGVALGLLGAGGVAIEFLRGRRSTVSGWRVSLTDLLLGTTIVAVFCGIYAWQRHRYEQQVAILKQIKSATEYPSSVDWYVAGFRDQSKWHHWLQLRFFDRVRSLSIDGEEIRYAVQLDTVKVLNIHGVSNSQLAQLSQMKNLEALDLFMEGALDEPPSNDIDPALRLPQLPKLRGLNLCDAAFRGDGLENVPALEQLDATDTWLDDSDVEALSKLKRLRSLSLIGTKISDEGMARLRAALPECQIDPP